MKKIVYLTALVITLLTGQSIAHSQPTDLRDSTSITKAEKLACAKAWADIVLMEERLFVSDSMLVIKDTLLMRKDSSMAYLINKIIVLEEKAVSDSLKIEKLKKGRKFWMTFGLGSGFLAGRKSKELF